MSQTIIEPTKLDARLPATLGPLIDLKGRRIEPERPPRKIPWMPIAIALGMLILQGLRNGH
jgi:hypothetical protein